MLRLINELFADKINQIVKKIFNKLNPAEEEYIENMVCYLIDYMGIKFGFDESTLDQYISLMCENDYQHIKSTIKMLFPYIDDTNDFFLFSQFSPTSFRNVQFFFSKVHF